MKSIKNKRHRKSLIFIVSLAIIIIATIGTYFVIYFLRNNQSSIDKTNNNTDIVVAPANQDKIVHFAAMGDMLAHDTIIANAKNGDSYDFAKYFQNIRSSYQDADVVFCNQEGLSSGENYGISGYPSFNAPIKLADDLQSGAGCNLINLANNHIADKGINAINVTLDEWAKLKPLGISGANKDSGSQEKVSYFTVNGVKFGFVSFMDFNNNASAPSYAVNNYHDEALVRRLVTDARSNSDVVVVSMHWGVEDSNQVSVDQKNQVSLLGSLGADIVIGTGPHVLQEAQTISREDGSKMTVLYSLGNMLSSQLGIKELIGGIAKFDVIKTVDGKISISNLNFIPTYMHYEWTSDQAARGDLLARKNAMIYTLNNASEPLGRSLFNTSVDIQKRYVIDTLGAEINVQ